MAQDVETAKLAPKVDSKGKGAAEIDRPRCLNSRSLQVILKYLNLLPCPRPYPQYDDMPPGTTPKDEK